MGQPAVWWSDQVVWARKCLAQAEAFALTVNDAVTNPLDPYAGELRRSRYAAAKADVEAWEMYAQQAEDAFQSAALHEMEQTDAGEVLDAAESIARKGAAAAHYSGLAEQARRGAS